MAGSAMDTLRGLLGDNADEKIKAALSSLSAAAPAAQQSGESSGSPENASSNASSGAAVQNALSGALDSGTLNSLMQIRDKVNQLTNSTNDSRSNLLMSLKPYMRTSRQGSIDMAVRMLNISKLSGLFRMR